jgi:hypothetical protein
MFCFRLNDDQRHVDYSVGVATSPTETDYFRSLNPGHYSITSGATAVATDTSGLLGKSLDPTLCDVTPGTAVCDVIDHAKQHRLVDHPEGGIRTTSHDTPPSRLNCYVRCDPFGECEHLSSGTAGSRWTTTRVDFSQRRDHPHGISWKKNAVVVQMERLAPNQHITHTAVHVLNWTNVYIYVNFINRIMYIGITGEVVALLAHVTWIWSNENYVAWECGMKLLYETEFVN